ncbi:PfkB family carbohydrate kinase [Paenibacillus alginolyticus]|uniref:PfkB family carbohydrate kinase n=1 Tax=Paenibacillus alginolyticus TaxID=59839 RepID=A0ABT4GAL2_9BACL|nr:PfkB family carbohydrate kinase [Paenibacillus alginolyticus]MCY9693225.1 PfkB family carbohydrate kinase [Paenibacillus alginolyticus]MEC0146006.1 PfkB family carbohydrate kinase [Paenibacillus alginolyticus]
MKLIGLGDNVVDYYLDLGKIFPGGNALNVAVMCKRFGAERCSYLGLLGDDRTGSHITDSLNQELIDISRIRIAAGPSGEARVAMSEDGDRVFVGSNRGGVQDLLTLRLNDDDLAYVCSHDVVHSSVYSHLEHELPKLKGVSVSFDFSTRQNPEYLQLVCPNLTYAFFSGSHLSLAECLNLMTYVHKFGVHIVGITRGSQGAIFSEKGKVYEQSIIPVSVVDTLGAGDSFISAFLTHYTQHCDMKSALQQAAESAALTCGYYGAFGYGIDK